MSLNSGIWEALVIFQTLVGMAEPVFRPLERGDPEFWHLRGSSYLPNSGWDGLSESVFRPLERGDPEFWHLGDSSYIPNSDWDG